MTATQPIDLVALRQPLPPMQFPNGKALALAYLRGPEPWQALNAYRADPLNVAKLATVLRYIVPNVADEDLDTLSVLEVNRLLAAGMGNLALFDAMHSAEPSTAALPDASGDAGGSDG